MTQYYYIASPVKLPQDSFGANPIDADNPNVFQTEYDFTHLYFENNYDPVSKAKFSFSRHFTYKHQVETGHNSLPLKNQINGTDIEAKCLQILYLYMENAIHSSNIIEYFTSVSGKENEPISVKRNVNWADIKDPYDLVLEDREFWEISLWR